MDFEQILEHSYTVACGHQRGLSRLEYLSEYIFDFTTYDSAIAELFASKALEVCAAINVGESFAYIGDGGPANENYRWYLLMVNMPFFAGRLDWGTSIRGAWWEHGSHKLESTGIWRGDEQVTSWEMTRAEWFRFISALIAFASTVGVPGDSKTVDGTRNEGGQHG